MAETLEITKEAAIKAVSYTHLDVYKRQQLDSLISCLEWTERVLSLIHI